MTGSRWAETTCPRMCSEVAHAAAIVLTEAYKIPANRVDCQRLVFSMLWEVGKTGARVEHFRTIHTDSFEVVISLGDLESRAQDEALEIAFSKAIWRFMKKFKTKEALDVQR